MYGLPTDAVYLYYYYYYYNRCRYNNNTLFTYTRASVKRTLARYPPYARYLRTESARPVRSVRINNRMSHVYESYTFYRYCFIYFFFSSIHRRNVETIRVLLFAVPVGLCSFRIPSSRTASSSSPPRSSSVSVPFGQGPREYYFSIARGGSKQ
jgi:hypothetical protein